MNITKQTFSTDSTLFLDEDEKRLSNKLRCKKLCFYNNWGKNKFIINLPGEEELANWGEIVFC